ncbi:MAG: hypothetical protein J6X10_07480 [Bacteroidales bacterium]|nr:hypothetical protein [Bacteroidales bacterium]
MLKQFKSIIIIAMIALVTLCGATSCNSSKKMSKKEYKALVAQATKDLNAILNDETEWTLEEQMDRINELKKVDFSKNPEIVEMLERAELKVTNAIAERDRIAEEKRLEEEQRLRELEEQAKPKTAISDYFNMIANARDVTSANNYIKEALKLFESPDAVVLIRLNNYGDYDRPTTAVNYLNYLKDQKKVTVNVDNIKYNENNKITELELIKK